MFKALVVDDEQIHREGLLNVIHKARPDYELFDAKNGKEALDIVMSNDIDIVITDVKMPLMDGLKFIEEIKQHSSKAKVVILSGYRNFDYAQKALSLGAYEYIVKPIRENDIVKVLEKLESIIKSDLEKKQESERLLKQLDSSLPVYFEKMMNNWIKNRATANELNDITSILSFKSKGILISSNIIGSDGPSKDPGIQQNIDSKNFIKFAMKEALDPIGHSLSFFYEENKNIMVTVLVSDDPSTLSLEFCTHRLEKFISSIKDSLAIEAVIGIGSPYDESSVTVKASFDSSMLALNYIFYSQLKRVAYYHQISGSMQSKCPDLSRFEDSLREAVRQSKKEMIGTLADDILKKALENGYPPPAQLAKTVSFLALKILSAVKDFTDEEYYNELLTDIERQLMASGTFEQLKSEFCEILTLFINIINNTKTNKHELIMEKCLQYIEEHFSEDISLETVAEVFYFSPSYFSLVFKNHTGMVFSKYLSQLRLKKAVNLLNNSDYKVYEIASKVGYKDDKYFYRVFKKEFGLTPDEYRRVL